VHDAQLHFRLGEGSFDGLGKALESVNAGDENILHSPVVELRHYLEPKLGPLGLLNPDTEDILDSLDVYPNCQVSALVYDPPFAAHLDNCGASR
jgi:hypothetical protein